MRDADSDFKWHPHIFDYGVYDPVMAGSIDATDVTPHDRALVRASRTIYRPNAVSGSEKEARATLFIGRLPANVDVDALRKALRRLAQLDNEQPESRHTHRNRDRDRHSRDDEQPEPSHTHRDRDRDRHSRDDEQPEPSHTHRDRDRNKHSRDDEKPEPSHTHRDRDRDRHSRDDTHDRSAQRPYSSKQSAFRDFGSLSPLSRRLQQYSKSRNKEEVTGKSACGVSPPSKTIHESQSKRRKQAEDEGGGGGGGDLRRGHAVDDELGDTQSGSGGQTTRARVPTRSERNAAALATVGRDDGENVSKYTTHSSGGRGHDETSEELETKNFWPWIRLVRHVITGQFRRYAFVRFRDESSAWRVLRRMDRSRRTGGCGGGVGLNIPDGEQVIVESVLSFNLPGWRPRRFGGGLSGRKESGQLRFGGVARLFRRPLLQASTSSSQSQSHRSGTRH